jgi:protocatechuate 3,4-dioxygenase beta subunit
VTLGADTRTTRNFALQKGAVLSGRVLDESGEPEENVTIQVFPGEDIAAAPFAVAAARTDDRGEYRIAALPPGPYRILAVIQRGARQEQMMYTGSQPGVERGLIRLAVGLEITGIDFNVRPPRLPALR